ncbi:hypothetical protein CEXT_629661 [Caerostris extrusa]|uniref:Uncharacterized protein n=1 Tax=Caerostris extrusa TaxID=172846 RepID=A0AAV4VV98_CAEEX|nr:hypothetical protein CEXT_629661 [Caerostris extrusa]
MDNEHATNDIVDGLAKGRTSMTQVNEEPLNYHELCSRSFRRDQTALARLSTGHLKPSYFSMLIRYFQFAPNVVMKKPLRKTTCVN